MSTTSKFRFIRVSTIDGCPTGSNDEELMRQFATSEDDFIIDLETNKWLMADGVEEELMEDTHEVSNEMDDDSDPGSDEHPEA
jgi:hypothetical protein